VALNIIGMYASLSGGTENAIANIDIPQDGVLLGIDWDINLNLDADNEDMAAELSFIATNQLSQNDVRGRIGSISGRLAVLDATGPQFFSIQKWVGPFELSLAAGERIYLHAVSATGVTGEIRCNLHFDGGAVVTRRSSRR